LEEVVAGLDIGTSSIKIVLYKKDKLIYTESLNHSNEESSSRELDPHKLIEDVFYLIDKARQENTNVKIKAIGLSSLFPSFIALDENGEPLTKIMTWMDPRGNELVNDFKKKEEKVANIHERTGCIVHASHTLWKILWLQKEKKEIFLKTRKFLCLSDYLTFKFTGKFVISYALASTTGLFNINTLEWDKEILLMAGLSKSQLSSCYNIYHTEKVNDKIRINLGLDEDTVLVIGAGDGQLSNIGSGCLSDESICSTIGTSAALRIIGGSKQYNNSIWKYYLYDRKYIKGIAINAGSSTLAWFYKNILKKKPDNVFNDIDEITFDQSTELTFLPFLDGERGPNYNQKMSASIFGLTSKSTNTEIFISIIEGILFNLYDCYRILVGNNEGIKEMVATGGYINSEKLIQMQSDLFNVKIKVPKIKEASALGAALVSLVAIGKISSISDIKTEYVKEYHPNPVKHENYVKKYRKYKILYEEIIKNKHPYEVN
jgi:gluconokinase